MVFSTSEGTLPPSVYPEYSFLPSWTPELWEIISRLLLTIEMEYYIKKNPDVYFLNQEESTAVGFSFFLRRSQIWKHT